jgi:hypothetical protein
MHLLIKPGGNVRCVYAETIDLTKVGRLAISRGSQVEPNEDGRWIVDLAPVNGPRLGPFLRRSNALIAEAEWLDAHWLFQPLD